MAKVKHKSMVDGALDGALELGLLAHEAYAWYTVLPAHQVEKEEGK